MVGLKEFKESISKISLENKVLPLLPIDSSILIKVVIIPDFGKIIEKHTIYLYNILAIPYDIDAIQLSYENSQLLPFSIDCKILYSTFKKLELELELEMPKQPELLLA